MRRTLLLLTLLVCFGASKSSAVVDSMYANNSTGLPPSGHPEYAYGAPDHQEAIISASGQEFFLRFERNGAPVYFAVGATIHIYWTKQAVDSEAAVLSLAYTRTDWYSPKSPDSIMIVNQPGMTTVTITKAGYNTLNFRLTGETGSSTPGSTSFYIDAATLIQESMGVSANAPMASLQLYPNPATVSSGISVTAPQEFVGHAELVVHNILGNEVERLPVDAATIHVAMASRGSYIATLLVDGVPTGKAYKFTVE